MDLTVALDPYGHEADVGLYNFGRFAVDRCGPAAVVRNAEEHIVVTAEGRYRFKAFFVGLEGKAGGLCTFVAVELVKPDVALEFVVYIRVDLLAVR